MKNISARALMLGELIQRLFVVNRSTKQKINSYDTAAVGGETSHLPVKQQVLTFRFLNIQHLELYCSRLQ